MGSTLTGRIAACKNPTIGSKMKSVCEELRLGRLSRRLSQAEVASKVGFSTATLCRIEKGEKQPSSDEILAIAKVLDQTPIQFDGGDSLTVISKLAETRKRLKIEISMEELSAVLGPKPFNIGKPLGGKGSSPLVFYVDLDEEKISDETEEERNGEAGPSYSSERQRG